MQNTGRQKAYLAVKYKFRMCIIIPDTLVSSHLEKSVVLWVLR